MTTAKSLEILFDIGHNEEVTPQEPELSQFIQLLENNGFTTHESKVALTEIDLSKYPIVVLGNPLNSKFNSQEIKTLMTFVESGAGLLLLSGATIFGKGGDSARKTNLNAIAKHYNFEFSNEAIRSSPEQEPSNTNAPDDTITAVPFAEHPIVEGINRLLFTSGTKIKTEKTNTHLFRAVNIPGSPTIVIATKAKQGRILAMGGTTPFFNSHIEVADHEVFIIQALRWLADIETNQPIVPLAQFNQKDDVTLTNKVIENLRKQLDRIEKELNDLKEIINSSLQDMEKVVRQFQTKEDKT